MDEYSYDSNHPMWDKPKSEHQEMLDSITKCPQCGGTVSKSIYRLECNADGNDPHCVWEKKFEEEEDDDNYEKDE